VRGVPSWQLGMSTPCNQVRWKKWKVESANDSPIRGPRPSPKLALSISAGVDVSLKSQPGHSSNAIHTHYLYLSHFDLQ